MIEYEVLHYPGDVRASEDCQPGRLLGVNEVGHPWEVIDAEYEPPLPSETRRGHYRGHTTVHLQTASASALRVALARQQESRPRVPRHVRRQRARVKGRA